MTGEKLHINGQNKYIKAIGKTFWLDTKNKLNFQKEWIDRLWTTIWRFSGKGTTFYKGTAEIFLHYSFKLCYNVTLNKHTYVHDVSSYVSYILFMFYTNHSY